MKDSGVQWIGQVPKHWIGYRMQYITRLEKGRMPQELTSTGGDAPYLTMDLLRNRETIVTYPANTKGLVRVEDNDLLLLWDGANAGEILQAKRGYLGSTMAIIHYSKEIIESKFAFYFFKALERRFKEDANGTTIPHFNRASLNSCMYFLPPTLSEQRAIADWLDAKCADIDAAIELQQRMIDKLKAYKIAVIHQAVTKGLDKNTNLKDSGVQWIGEVPQHWEVCKIKNICTYVNRGCAPNYVENGTYYAMNQATFSKGFLDYSSLKFTTENRKSAQVLKQDILLASTGGGILGKVFYYNEESDLFYADSHVTILRVNKRTNDSRYLFYNLAIKYDLINALLAKGSTNQTELQRDLLKNHYIQCPPLTEQRAIADWLDAKCADIDATIALKEQKQEKLKAYKKTIIFEYVTGKKQVANINK